MSPLRADGVLTGRALFECDFSVRDDGPRGLPQHCGVPRSALGHVRCWALGTNKCDDLCPSPCLIHSFTTAGWPVPGVAMTVRCSIVKRLSGCHIGISPVRPHAMRLDRLRPKPYGGVRHDPGEPERPHQKKGAKGAENWWWGMDRVALRPPPLGRLTALAACVVLISSQVGDTTALAQPPFEVEVRELWATAGDPGFSSIRGMAQWPDGSVWIGDGPLGGGFRGVPRRSERASGAEGGRGSG